LRIIRGSYRGHRIVPPGTFHLKPTTDLAKESLFNILENNFDLEKVSVLDLFSGTGNISYEFASRGTPHITLVEINNRHIGFIRDTLRQLNFRQVEALQGNVFPFLRHALPHSFDIIFADPPYDLPDIETLPKLVFKHNLLTPRGWFILEHPKQYHFEDHPRFRFMKKYSQVHFSFFEEEAEDKINEDKDLTS